MTLGRTSSGAIKIKTDGGLRAVSCACCAPPCNCNPPLTVKYKFTAASFGSILNLVWQGSTSTNGQFWDPCGTLVAATSTGHTISANRRCTNGTTPHWFDGWEIYAVGGNNNECYYLLAWVFGDSPVGTHTLVGNFCYDEEVACPCGGHLNGGSSSPWWTLTIEEDTE